MMDLRMFMNNRTYGSNFRAFVYIQALASPQFLDEDKKFDSLGDFVFYIVMVTFCINFSLQFFFDFPMRQQWKLLDSLQLISHVALFTIAIPSNAICFFKSVILISNMDVIPNSNIKKTFKLSDYQNTRHDPRAFIFDIF
eukprot:403334726